MSEATGYCNNYKKYLFPGRFSRFLNQQLLITPVINSTIPQFANLKEVESIKEAINLND